ncbi:MAG: hypothetical protein JST86_14170 [Bacteroidetes bacterium]|nr:hypothetical protein [Bacteroidota bacterium]
MKGWVLFFCFSFSLLYSAAQDVEAIVKEADRLEAVPNEYAALLKYKEALKIKPDQIHALSKSSELCSRIGQRQTKEKVRDDYYAAAKIYAETALRIDSTSSEANTSMAIILGRTTLIKSGKEKVIAAKDLKKYVDAALKSNPSNFLAWHVLGRWHYEISNLNAIERAAVKILYGSFPPSSLKESIAAFEKSKALMGAFILNDYELARAYHRNDQNDKAIAILKEMMQLPNKTEDDASIKEKGQKLLKELQ